MLVTCLPRADRFALMFLSLKRIHFGIVVFVFFHTCSLLFFDFM